MPANGSADKLIAEIPGPSKWRAGDRVSLGIDVGKVLLFNPETGRNREVLQ